MLLEFTPGTTFLHRADVRSKLFAFVAIIIVAFLFRTPGPMVALAVLCVLGLVHLGLGWRAIAKLLAPLAVVVIFIFVFAALSPPGRVDQTVLFHLLPGERLAVTVGGISYGVSLAMRIITMVCASAILVISTAISQFTILMQQLRVPNVFVFIVVTALRFVPTMQARSDQILDAQRARGARIDSGGIIGKIRAFVTIMVPLFASGIRMSEELAGAMVSRGYGVSKRPTRLHDLSWRLVDTMILVATAALIALAIWTRQKGF